MGIEVGSNFDMKAALPLDSRDTVQDLAERDAIPTGIRYLGMTVFVRDELMRYILKTGITDSDWEEDAGGGGAGELNPIWYADEDAPFPGVFRGIPTWQFDNLQGQKLFTLFKVPNSYKGAKQIFMRSHFSSADTSSNDVLIKAQTTLIRSMTDLVTSTTNQYISTNTAKVQGAGVAGKPQPVVHDLTTFHGQINSEPVIPGDWLLITLYRDTDSSTLPIIYYPQTTGVTFG